MKTIFRTLFAVATGLLFCQSTVQADPHFGGRHFGYGHHHFNAYPRFGFYWGAPVWPRTYYIDPYYQPYYPPAVVTVPPPSPPVYIERSPPLNNQLPSGYWYYCSNPEGYYPYVNDCPTGWRQVDPVPPR